MPVISLLSVCLSALIAISPISERRPVLTPLPAPALLTCLRFLLLERAQRCFGFLFAQVARLCLLLGGGLILLVGLCLYLALLLFRLLLLLVLLVLAGLLLLLTRLLVLFLLLLLLLVLLLLLLLLLAEQLFNTALDVFDIELGVNIVGVYGQRMTIGVYSLAHELQCTLLFSEHILTVTDVVICIGLDRRLNSCGSSRVRIERRLVLALFVKRVTDVKIEFSHLGSVDLCVCIPVMRFEIVAIGIESVTFPPLLMYRLRPGRRHADRHPRH